MQVLMTDEQVSLAFKAMTEFPLPAELPEELQPLPEEAWHQLAQLLLSLYQSRAMATLH